MGPLGGLRVIELCGQGPGPYCGMILADLGCDVVVVDRPADAERADTSKPATNLFMRGKRSIALDLKQHDDVELLLGLLADADAFIDPFRPGVCERLGIGPDVVCARNPRLIYGRMTGFGQDGPLALAGHDIDYIALSGALWMLGREGDKPTPPINLLGDFAGGGLILALGIAAAAFERVQSGVGQVIDAAMVDGAALVAAPFYVATQSGFWGPRGTNHIDTGAHFYEVYECSDGRYVAVGAIEPQFYAELLLRLELPGDEFPQWDRAQWPALKERIATVFRTRTRDEWCRILEGSEACFAPVLTPDEAIGHPHNVHRGTFVEINGTTQPGPAPRFSRTPGHAGKPTHPGEHTAAARDGTLWTG